MEQRHRRYGWRGANGAISNDIAKLFRHFLWALSISKGLNPSLPIMPTIFVVTPFYFFALIISTIVFQRQYSKPKKHPHDLAHQMCNLSCCMRNLSCCMRNLSCCMRNLSCYMRNLSCYMRNLIWHMRNLIWHMRNPIWHMRNPIWRMRNPIWRMQVSFYHR